MSIQILKVLLEKNDIRLDIFLTKTLPDKPSRSFVKRLVDGGHVRVNEGRVKAHHKVSVGEDVYVDIPEDFGKPQYIGPEDIPLDISYEDEALIVVNKPIGMTVHPAQGNYTGTLVNALLNYSVNLSNVNEEMRPGIVHRLDKETSGLILIAKDNITHTKLAKQFKRREIHKRYVALVEGEIEFDEGKVNAPIGRNPRHHEKKQVQFQNPSAKEAITYYRVLKRVKGVSLVALFPKTGRTHQLRVHMQYLRHAILGDEKYGKRKSFLRLALHAQSIGFKHPRTNQYLEVSCKVPQSFIDKIN
ncbi:Ribosomal large subunit pseudouridine synthase D [hydrothermal vent metagenome]|uniref:Ribosomal large subunit pseudouridine synthase D n=1 Tax=hydrothermal vent metagenome TaxID=652676 RepID=A0A3B0W161_9ZZZZ